MLCRVQAREWEETLLGEGEPVLLCRSRLPELSLLEERALRRFNRYYAHVEERFRRWCRRRLFASADGCRRAARERSRPFEPWTVRLDWEDRWEADSGILCVRLLLGGEGEACVERVQRWELGEGLLV